MRTRRGLASGLMALFAASALVGCGGGGGGGNSSNRAPTANAGPDQALKRNANVTLDGSASADADGDSLAYRWVQTGGTPVTLSSSTAARPTFTTPNQSGVLNFSLTTNDGKVDSTTDSVTVTVQNTAPTAISAAPTAAVGLGQMAVLDGSGSTDADGDALTYTWTQLAGPAVDINYIASGVGQFRVPYWPEVFVFSLTVSDGEATSVTINITINVTVAATPPLAPIVSAGDDFDAARRSPVTLSGWAWDPNYDSVSYAWEQVGGPPVTLSNPNVATPSFTAPETPAQLRFALRASDGTHTSEPDEIVVNVRNYAPSVYGAAITPTTPHTNDTLLADTQVFDSDSDALTTTYEWRRNGTLVGSQTSNTFPASLTTKNDVIAVRIIVNDGEEQTTVDASTTILDSPAVLTAQTAPPTTLNYGATANFTVTAIDPDGDPVPGYEVAFGPAGFAVTSNGDVSWTAAGPLFDRSTDFNWGVKVIGDAASLLSGTIEVTDATRVYPLRRTNLSIPVQNSGLYIGDLDGDGAGEMLVGSYQSVYVLSRSGTTYQQSWVYPFEIGTADFYGSGMQAVTAADIDGDGHQEIYASKGGELIRLDGVSRRKVASTSLRCRWLEVADLDGNGTKELVCLGTTSSYQYETNGRIYVLNASTLAEIWSTPELNVGSGLAIGNVDADPALEIVAAGGFVYDGATGQNQWAYSQPFGGAVDTGDMDGDGIEEIIGMVDWSAVRAFSAVYKSPLWEYVPSWTILGALTVADANGDGVVEAIVANNQGGNVMGVGYNMTTHQPELLWQTATLGSGVSAVGVGDVDADGTNEVVWGTGSGSSGRDEIVIAGFTPTISGKWRSSIVGELNGPFYGGELARIGAGDQRLMFAVAQSDSGYSGLRAIALTPMTGDVESTAEIGTNWANSAAITVADYDNDNIDELFLGTANLYSGYFTAYDFAARSTEWQSPQFQQQSAIAAKQADMNGDGHADFVGLTAGGYIEIHNVHAQSLLWRSTSLGGSVALALGDLDNDGEQEIVVALWDRIVVYGKALGTYLERASIQFSSAVDVVVADLDGDSDREIYVLGGRYTYDPTNLYLYDKDLHLLRSVPLGTHASALFVEKSAFARKNLVLSISGDQYASTATHAELWAVDPVTGADVWRSPPLSGTVPRNGLQFVDVDGDGTDEIVFGTNWGMHHTR